MRLVVYTDYSYRRAGDGVYAERAFVLFLARIAASLEHTVVVGRLDPRPGAARYRLPDAVEFVPLPFVHMAAPIYLKGKARRGPTFEEALKMHAVARIALHGFIPNIQVSWVKMGVEGSKLALQAGCNDLGGTLMNENISRAAGASHGQGLEAEEMEALVRSIGRTPRRRTTLYEAVSC